MWLDLMIAVVEVGIHFKELGPCAGVDGAGGVTGNRERETVNSSDTF